MENIEEQFEIIKNLTPAQKADFNKGIQDLFVQCHNAVNGDLKKLKEVIVNMRVLDEVFLNITLGFNQIKQGVFDDKVSGVITNIYQYPNREGYDKAVEEEKLLNQQEWN